MPFLKTLIFTVVVPGTVAGYLPLQIASHAPPFLGWAPGGLRFLAIVPGLLGGAIYCWCAWDFASKGRGTPLPIDPPKALIAQGLYRYMRNPMYVGVLLVILAQAIWFGTAALILYGAAVFTFFQLFIVLYEEPTLRKMFGESYADYCRRVPRWLPRPPQSPH